MSFPTVISQAPIRASLGQRLERMFRGTGHLWRTQPLGMAGATVLLILLAAAVFAPLASPYDPNEMYFGSRLEAPSTRYWLGTDQLARDQFSRLLYGTRISFIVAFLAIGIGKTVGYSLGIVSAYLGGKFDMFVQRFVDAMLAFPSILLALTMVAALGPGLDKVIIAIAVTTFPSGVRIARGTVLSVKENVYIDASRVIGASPIRIMFRHILPNSLAPFLIIASVSLGGAILAEASLSYLGLGVPPPHASWGRALSGGAVNYMLSAPWLMIAPGVAITHVWRYAAGYLGPKASRTMTGSLVA